jgi:ABC-type phosphate transport system substrate-binding protein
MSARKTLGGVLVATLATASVIGAVAPAHAAYTADPDDTAFAPASTDLIGVGSDTSQHAIKLLADAWNGSTPAPSYKIASFAATTAGGPTPTDGSSTISLPGGASIARPNGSGAGKGRLYGANDTAEVDFARSSSSLNSDEKAANLKQFPFAVDVLKTAVSNNVASHAPASLTRDQLLKIYDGTFTTWDQVGGSTNDPIVPMIPQNGSGTRSFFLDQLKAANGGTAVVLAGTVQTVQEHDDSQVKGNPNAIAPFSAGRAQLLGSTLRLEGGFEAKRALYNVVRGADVANPKITAVFGSDGFLCSEQASQLIKDAGFDQLAGVDNGGVCGEATIDPTTNFTTSAPAAPITTQTAVSGTSPAAKKVVVKAKITGSKTPEGTVTFTEGGTVVGANVPVIGGTATLTLSNVAPGTHRYTAAYSPAVGTVFQPSEQAANVVVKTSAKLTETFPAKNKAGKKAKGAVVVTLAGTATKATGKVTVKVGSKVVGTGTLVNGKATITLKKLKKGNNTLVATWGGNALAPAASLAFTIKQK